MNWIFDMFDGSLSKKAEMTNKEIEFERKIDASDWIKETMDLPEEVEKSAVESENVPFDEVSAIMAWESGDLSVEDTLELFSELIKNGHAWSLQGVYGRTAKALIDAGYLDENGEILNPPDRDEDGNILHSGAEISASKKAAFKKIAAYEVGDTKEDTIKKDYKLALSGMSDYNLAEMLADLKCSSDLLATLDFNEEKDKILKSVKSNRSSVESKILSLLGDHSSIDWKESFAKFEEVDVVHPKDADLYEKMPSGKWRKKTKFVPLSDEEKVKQMEGVGKEEEKGALAKDASLTKVADEAAIRIALETLLKKLTSGGGIHTNPYGVKEVNDAFVALGLNPYGDQADQQAPPSTPEALESSASLKITAYHIGDKVYYHGHPSTIKDMVLNPHALEVSVTIDCDGEELHISGKELKEIGSEPLMEDLQHSEVPAIPEMDTEIKPQPEIEKLPEQPTTVVEEACMAKKEAAALKCPDCGTSASVTPAFGHKLNKCDSCGLAFDNESSPDYVEPEEKEANLEVDAATNTAVIKAFVNGHAENMKTKSSHLYMRPIISGVELVNYQTVIAVRVDDAIRVSTKSYSPTTSKIQRAIIDAANASGKSVVSMETGQPIDPKVKWEKATPKDFTKLETGKPYDKLAAPDEIQSKASKADVIAKFSMLSRHADIDSPWRVIKNDKGEDIIARTSPTLREKRSKEKNKKVDIKSQENI